MRNQFERLLGNKVSSFTATSETLLRQGLLLLLLLLLAVPIQAAAGTLIPYTTFTDNSNGTVTDSTTGLTWMRCSRGQTWNGTTCAGTSSMHSWDNANAPLITFAGFSDWHVPDYDELITIFEQSPTRIFSRHCINSTVFPSTPSARFWSSTSSSFTSAVFVDFGCGTVFGGYAQPSGAATRSATNYVRLVRGTGAATPPACTLTATPSTINIGGQTTLTASCTPAATSYIWSNCSGNTNSCTVSPSVTTTYTVKGSNARGTGNTASATVTVNPAVKVIEFYNTTLDNYFITADAGEAAQIDGGAAGPGWIRTGNTFNSGGSASVCRFYGSVMGPNSHFYTADAGECAYLKSIYNPAAKSWKFESNDFSTTSPANGSCPSGMVPVYRAYNNGAARGVDSNHRITSNLTAINQQVTNCGWKNEGVVMCAASGVASGGTTTCRSTGGAATLKNVTVTTVQNGTSNDPLAIISTTGGSKISYFAPSIGADPTQAQLTTPSGTSITVYYGSGGKPSRVFDNKTGNFMLFHPRTDGVGMEYLFFNAAHNFINGYALFVKNGTWYTAEILGLPPGAVVNLNRTDLGFGSAVYGPMTAVDKNLAALITPAGQSVTMNRILFQKMLDMIIPSAYAFVGLTSSDQGNMYSGPAFVVAGVVAIATGGVGIPLGAILMAAGATQVGRGYKGLISKNLDTINADMNNVMTGELMTQLYSGQDPLGAMQTLASEVKQNGISSLTSRIGTLATNVATSITNLINPPGYSHPPYIDTVFVQPSYYAGSMDIAVPCASPTGDPYTCGSSSGGSTSSSGGSTSSSGGSTSSSGGSTSSSGGSSSGGVCYCGRNSAGQCNSGVC